MKEKRWYLVHAYGGYERKNPKPDVDGSLQVLAAAELWREDRGRTIGGFVFNCAVPYKDTTLAESMSSHLRRLIPTIPDESVVSSPLTTTTRGEVKNFKEFAEERGLSDLVSIGRPWHLERIGIAAEREFGIPIPLKSSDELLRAVRSNRYNSILDKWNKNTESGFKKREVIIQLFNKIPFTDGKILEILDRLMGSKRLEFAVAKIFHRK